MEPLEPLEPNLPSAPKPHEAWKGKELWKVRSALSYLTRAKRKLDTEEMSMGRLLKIAEEIKTGELAPLFTVEDIDWELPESVSALRFEVEEIIRQFLR